MDDAAIRAIREFTAVDAVAAGWRTNGLHHGRKEFWSLRTDRHAGDAGAASRNRDSGRTDAFPIIPRPRRTRPHRSTLAPAAARSRWRLARERPAVPRSRRRRHFGQTRSVSPVKNARQLDLANVDLPAPVTGRSRFKRTAQFDIMVSNPPYVREGRCRTSTKLRHSSRTGRSRIRRRRARRHPPPQPLTARRHVVNADGWLLLEHGADAGRTRLHAILSAVRLARYHEQPPGYAGLPRATRAAARSRCGPRRV